MFYHTSILYCFRHSFLFFEKNPGPFLLRTNKTRFVGEIAILTSLCARIWYLHIPISNMGTIGANLREALAKENYFCCLKSAHWWGRSSQFWWCVNCSWWSLCFGWLIIIRTVIIRLFLQLAKVY
jgi:hypothetical protein